MAPLQLLPLLFILLTNINQLLPTSILLEIDKYGGVMSTMLWIQDYGLFSMCVLLRVPALRTRA